jgi:hypothetical protein
MPWFDLFVKALPPSAMDRARQIAAAQRAAEEERRRREALKGKAKPSDAGIGSNPDTSIARRPIGVRSADGPIIGLSHYGWADQDLTPEEAWRFYCGDGTQSVEFGSGPQPLYAPGGPYVQLYPRGTILLEWLPVEKETAVIVFRRINYGWVYDFGPLETALVSSWQWDITECMLVSMTDIRRIAAPGQLLAALDRFAPIPVDPEPPTVINGGTPDAQLQFNDFPFKQVSGLKRWGLWNGDVDDDNIGAGGLDTFTPGVFTALERDDLLPADVTAKSAYEQKRDYLSLITTPTEWLGGCMVAGACDPVNHFVEFGSSADWANWTIDIYTDAAASVWQKEPTTRILLPEITIPSEDFPYPKWNTRWHYSRMTWDWEDPGYCSQKLAELGFTPEMLAFPPEP